MEQNNNEQLDNWEGFLGSNFLNVKDVKDNQVFVATGVELDAENNRPMLILESEGIKSKFSLNITNATFVKDAGLKSPKEVIGKKVHFRKTMAYSPSAKKDVQTLRIDKIE